MLASFEASFDRHIKVYVDVLEIVCNLDVHFVFAPLFTAPSRQWQMHVACGVCV